MHPTADRTAFMYINRARRRVILLKRVETDLGGFLARLGKWVSYVSPGFEQAVVKHFAKNMNIGAGRT